MFVTDGYQASIFTGVHEPKTTCFTYELLMSFGRSLCDSLVLNDNKSSGKMADFNDPSVCMSAAILNRLRSVTSGHTCLCQFENTREYGVPHCF